MPVQIGEQLSSRNSCSETQLVNAAVIQRVFIVRYLFERVSTHYHLEALDHLQSHEAQTGKVRIVGTQNLLC